MHIEFDLMKIVIIHSSAFSIYGQWKFSIPRRYFFSVAIMNVDI